MEITDVELDGKALEIKKKYGFYYDLNELLSLKSDYQPQANLEILTDDFAPINYLDAVEMNNTKM